LYNDSQNYSYIKKDNSKIKNNKKNIKNENKPKFQLDIKEKKTFKTRSGLLSKHTIKNDIKKSDYDLKKSDEKLRKLTKKVPICVPNYKPKINSYHPKKSIYKKENAKNFNHISKEVNNDINIY